MATVADFIREWNDNRPYVIAHTSGSTGTPKEIRLPKRDMLASARATNDFFNITASSTLALPLSVDYIAGKMMVVRAQAASCRLLELPVSNDISINERVDLLAIVPTQLNSLLSDREISAKVKNLIIGGAPLDNDAIDRIKASNLNAFATYGMTETYSHVALAPLNGKEVVYQAIPGIKFSADTRGCLVIHAPHFSFGTLATNDIVRLDSESSFEWIGRYDNIINSGGLKINPEQIEREVSSLFPHLDFYIVGVPDGYWGQAVAMVFVGKDEDIQFLRQNLRASLSDKRLTPHRYIAVAELPHTSNGKIRRLNPEDLKSIARLTT